MIRVITIAREFGSGGAAIASQVAERLRWRLLDRGIVEQAARSAQVDPAVAERLDEQVDPWLHRLGRSFWRGGFEGVATVDEEELLDADRMAQLTAQLLREAAEMGDCVIVGRAAQCVLGGRSDTLHVFVYGPHPARVRRLQRRLPPGTDVDAVIAARDAERASYVRRHFGCSWDDRHLYHLMVNSAGGEDAATAAILGVLNAINARG
jgi:cytidylate kinase